MELPSELTTGSSYLKLYVDFILAFQERARVSSGQPDLVLPLAIMTSGNISFLFSCMYDNITIHCVVVLVFFIIIIIVFVCHLVRLCKVAACFSKFVCQ